ncbi:hypothetical protein M885DRAFT_513145 [Pelagophyceae sp. CCMP2097]|nr:hypothetical protein M885DRAFT_513145 [Pelagophyceae sp. CCMP2097]
MKTAVLALLAAVAHGLVPPPASKAAVAVKANTFEAATASFKTQFPIMNANGWGVSTKAERWNGRHAMFGWVFIVGTGYMQSHGLIPDGDKMLSIKDWGTLAQIVPGSSTITNERAIIMIANLHALAISILATFSPLSAQDTLLIGAGEVDEEPVGLMPPLQAGLTPAAEIFNGRLAMLGLTVTAGYSLIYQIPMLNAVDQLLGGKLLA